MSCGQDCQKGELYTRFCEKELVRLLRGNQKAAYVSLVRSHLEYATAVWDPYRQNQMEKLEAVQSRAVRFIKHDHDYNTQIEEISIFGITKRETKIPSPSNFP